jgi:hypothetical protein
MQPVTFDLIPADVEKRLGPPERVITNDEGQREERRGAIDIRYSTDDGKVVEIACVRGARLAYEDHDDLFERPHLIEFLMRFDPTPQEAMGFLVFLNLGITVTGFHDEDESQKAIVAFRRGRMDEFRSMFHPYSPKSS